MATGSNILAWKIPWTKEPGGRQSMGLQSIRREGAHTGTLTESLRAMKQPGSVHSTLIRTHTLT